jgi:hypothetical protein
VFDSLFVCGDSFPYGYELDESIREQVNFPALIARHFSVPVYNFSMQGGGNDRIQRMCFTELPKLKNKNPFVIIPWSQPHRAEFWDARSRGFQILHPPPGADDDFSRLYFTQHSSSSSDVLRTFIAKISVQNLLKQLNLNYLFIEMFDDRPPVPKIYKHLEELVDMTNFLPGHLGEQYKGCLMAPGGHPLEEGHRKMADYLIKEIETRHV